MQNNKVRESQGKVYLCDCGPSCKDICPMMKHTLPELMPGGQILEWGAAKPASLLAYICCTSGKWSNPDLSAFSFCFLLFCLFFFFSVPIIKFRVLREENSVTNRTSKQPLCCVLNKKQSSSFSMSFSSLVWICISNIHKVGNWKTFFYKKS